MAKKTQQTTWAGALMEKLTGRASGGHERIAKKPVAERLGWLSKRNRGDEEKTAAAAGVTRRTLKSWLSGKSKPSAKSMDKLDRAEREAMTRLVSAKDRAEMDSSTKRIGTRSRDARVTGGAFLSGTIRVSQDERDRLILFGRHMPSGFMDEVRQAFVEGGQEAAIKKMEDGLADHYFGTSDFEIISVDELSFDGISDPLGDVGDADGRYISDVESLRPGDILED
ncbi:helix-turn-helix transcriptional regulator [Streptomyces sp. NPDC048659]|uniref:helix-turn-helix domain-containing protein n=1 Tax=Streptomyces sp. NPDC048659 TaxID=3155489 RepID=UPI003427EF10